MSTLGAIFVGGASRRMGGFPKGNLIAPSGEPLWARLRDLFAALGVPCALVGEAGAYGSSGLPVLADVQAGCGPLAGLVAALEHSDVVLAVACDLPLVSASLLARLLRAPAAAVVAPITDGIAQPLCARYESRRALPVARARLARGKLSLRGVLEALGVTELPLLPGEPALLVDWDTPEDVDRYR